MVLDDVHQWKKPLSGSLGKFLVYTWCCICGGLDHAMYMLALLCYDNKLNSILAMEFTYYIFAVNDMANEAGI